MTTTTNRLRAVSNSGFFSPKGETVQPAPGLRVSPARRAVTILASVALAALPIRLGDIEATSDGAVLMAAANRQGAGVLLSARALAPREYVRRASRAVGWTGREWRCLDAIVYAESRWNPQADNPRSSAFGLFQQLRLDAAADVAKQTRLGLKYVAHRYGTPCQALRFRVANGWY